jgi:restriction system protein
MPTIRIDDEVWKALQERAKPFVDTPNDVLRRVFELDQVVSSSSASVPGKKAKMRVRIGATPEHEYRLPIVESLLELGESAVADDVLKKVYKRVESRLKPIDEELMENSTEPRWRNYARWERKNMVMDGLLKPDSPHGLWELTEKGRRYHQ